MYQDTETTIREVAARLWTLPIEDYLSSEQFSRFCMDYNLGDEWNDYLELSRDMPELYGHMAIKNAFVRFLHYLFRRRPGEFLALFTRILVDFSRGISCALPLRELKSDLQVLGYSDQEIEREFSRLKTDRQNAPEPRDSDSP